MNKENIFIFAFKQLCANPLQFMCFLFICGLVFLYQDMREFMNAQTAAFQEFTIILKQQSLRLQTLENYHLQELTKGENQKR